MTTLPRRLPLGRTPIGPKVMDRISPIRIRHKGGRITMLRPPMQYPHTRRSHSELYIKCYTRLQSARESRRRLLSRVDIPPRWRPRPYPCSRCAPRGGRPAHLFRARRQSSDSSDTFGRNKAGRPDHLPSDSPALTCLDCRNRDIRCEERTTAYHTNRT